MANMPMVDEPEEYVDSYAPRPPTMFEGSENCHFTGGTFVVQNEATMLASTRGCTFDGGKYKASGYGAEMFRNGKGNHYNDGAEYTVDGRRVHPPGHIFHRGTSTATGGIFPEPANYGTAQPSGYPNGQQNNDSRTQSMGGISSSTAYSSVSYTANYNATHSSLPVMPTQGYSYGQQYHPSRPYHNTANYNATHSSLPIMPTQGYSYGQQYHPSRPYDNGTDSSATSSRSPATHTQSSNTRNVHSRSVHKVNTIFTDTSRSEGERYFDNMGEGNTLGGGKVKKV